MTLTVDRQNDSLIHEAWDVIKHWSNWHPLCKHSDQYGTYAISVRGPRASYVVTCKQGFHNSSGLSVMRDRVLDRAIDMAEDKAIERDVRLPPEIIGQIALQMYQTRMMMAFRDPDEYEFPDDDGRGMY